MHGSHGVVCPVLGILYNGAANTAKFAKAHLSFQEMLAAKFCSGVVYFAKNKNQVRQVPLVWCWWR